MKILPYTVIFKLFSFVTISSSLAIDSVYDSRKGDSDLCKEGICGSRMPSNEYLRRMYNGLFRSAADIKILDRVSNAALATPVMKVSLSDSEYRTSDDGAICCSTLVEHLNKTKMVNIDGIEVSIIHISNDPVPEYQYIPHASCVRTGVCPGECVIEGKILSLLTWSATEGMKFDSFEVPGYCACKKLGTAKR